MLHSWSLRLITVSTDEWSAQPTTGEKPPPLSHHTFTKIDHSRAVVFGGLTRNSRLNDSYILDMETWVWKLWCMCTCIIYIHIVRLVCTNHLAVGDQALWCVWRDKNIWRDSYFEGANGLWATEGVLLYFVKSSAEPNHVVWSTKPCSLKYCGCMYRRARHYWSATEQWAAEAYRVDMYSLWHALYWLCDWTRSGLLKSSLHVMYTNNSGVMNLQTKYHIT